MGVKQDHQIVDMSVLAIARHFPRSLQHSIHLVEVKIGEQGRDSEDA